jgi:hypothetical protein
MHPEADRLRTDPVGSEALDSPIPVAACPGCGSHRFELEQGGTIRCGTCRTPIQRHRWSGPAEPSLILGPEWVRGGEFRSFAEWADKAPSWLKPYRGGRSLCFDARGRLCQWGVDMHRARDEGAFPVTYFVREPPGAGALTEVVHG